MKEKTNREFELDDSELEKVTGGNVQGYIPANNQGTDNMGVGGMNGSPSQGVIENGYNSGTVTPD